MEKEVYRNDCDAHGELLFSSLTLLIVYVPVAVAVLLSLPLCHKVSLL